MDHRCAAMHACHALACQHSPCSREQQMNSLQLDVFAALFRWCPQCAAVLLLSTACSASHAATPALDFGVAATALSVGDSGADAGHPVCRGRPCLVPHLGGAAALARAPPTMDGACVWVSAARG